VPSRSSGIGRIGWRSARGSPKRARSVRLLTRAGLTDPVSQLRSDLAGHADLVPVKGVYGGKMGFYDRDGVVLLPGRYVYAPAEDGHILVHTVLKYDVKPGGKIEWKMIDAAQDR
jgi:hypothetical protein